MSRRVAAGAVALGLTAAGAVVAIAGSAPLSHSAPVNGRAAQTPITALFVLLAGAGTVAFVALVVIIWPGRLRKSDEEPEQEIQRPPVHWLWQLLSLLAIVALGVALILAAEFGVRSTTNANQRGQSLPPGGPLGRVTVPRHSSGSSFTLPSWLPWTALGIVVVALLAGAVLVAVRLREPPPEEEPQRTATRAAVQDAIDALDHAGDSRAAVIASYAAMERALAAHGLARSPGEAAREYLRRVLTVPTGAERDAQTLTSLFEEARFSTHSLPERVRGLAAASLASLRSRLDADPGR